MADVRREIDLIDDEILRLLNLRAGAAIEAARIKRIQGRAQLDHEREVEIMSLVCRANTGPLPDEAIERIFRRIIDESRLIGQTAHAHSANCVRSG